MIKQSSAIVTYLFGAGASIGALPIVKDIPKELNEFKKFLMDQKSKVNSRSQNPTDDHNKLETLIGYIDKINNEARNHQSIDTYAKKLIITRNFNLLNELKAIMILFFNYCQLKNPVDNRYDSFIASLHTGNISRPFPDNLRILSWNYDYQFEKAFSSYSDDVSLYSNQEKLSVFPRDVFSVNNDRAFSIVKLNGTTAAISNKADLSNLINDFEERIDSNFVKKSTNLFFAIKNRDLEPMIHFAWETYTIKDSIIRSAIESTQDTQILVIIGYSFPFFNRQIDREIIRNMKLEKVYYQAPGKEAHKFIDRFKAIRTDVKEIYPIEEVDQFFLPPEL